MADVRLPPRQFGNPARHRTPNPGAHLDAAGAVRDYGRGPRRALHRDPQLRSHDYHRHPRDPPDEVHADAPGQDSPVPVGCAGSARLSVAVGLLRIQAHIPERCATPRPARDGARGPGAVSRSRSLSLPRHPEPGVWRARSWRGRRRPAARWRPGLAPSGRADRAGAPALRELPPSTAAPARRRAPAPLPRSDPDASPAVDPPPEEPRPTPKRPAPPLVAPPLGVLRGSAEALLSSAHAT